ncbi:IclR family transcriptional regulator [Novosphingobium sp. Gsoil 351]|uniref:IclR family transcriptional regulator n=1 Tax=Novosphingobium sp. Gsoil 351 TaxID=2675225 RepID=UPI0012B4512A|nr:helix-turn-helix domain-containing protein [Novosphingobium sp. Gsoil 351]QGN55821.1 helix-turn-helix domain-containing protein [Novosphingobium sp. Gsoil 351]
MAQDLVKSAARAIEILELFAARRQPMTATQLGTALGYPKSSMSGLVKSLVSQGYLSANGVDQAYFPTLKLSRLGEWVPGALLGSETLLPLLSQLRDATGETVTLTIAADLHMRCLHALIGTHPIALQVEEGVSFPMIGTAIGTMYLATQEPARVEAIFERWGRDHADQREVLSEIALAVDKARTVGHATAFDIVIPDTGAIAMPLWTRGFGEPMILAVAGLNRRIRDREEQIVALMQAINDSDKRSSRQAATPRDL